MKRTISILLLVALLAGCLSIPAFAADDSGIQSATVLEDFKSNVTAKVEEGKEKLTVTYSAATSGKDYVVFLLKDGGKLAAPDKDNIFYIDGKKVSDTSISFSIFPKTGMATGDYGVYLSSNADSGIASLTRIANVSYKAKYTPGNVCIDFDEKGAPIIDVSDASDVLCHIAELKVLEGESFLAADVAEPKNVIDVSDASMILCYIAELIDSLG